MSKANPRKAMAALLPLPIKVGREGRASARPRTAQRPSLPAWVRTRRSASLPAQVRTRRSASLPARPLTVAPMTLGMFAALERIGSPMVSKREPKDLVELIPSLYLLTHGAKEIFRPDFFDAAFAWADTVPTSVVAEIRTACARQLNAVFDVIPEDDGKKKAPPATTAGSPRSSTGPRGPTTGRSKRSCTTCRSRRSASCGGKTPCGKTGSSHSLKSRR